MRRSAIPLPCEPIGMIGTVTTGSRRGSAYLLKKHLGLLNPPKPPKTYVPSWGLSLMNEARKRARKRGMDFKLTRESMAALIERADGKCELSGVPFNNDPGDGRRRPFAASLDRIDCKKGYTPKNCRLVVYAVNAAMNEWGYETLLTVARGVVSCAE